MKAFFFNVFPYVAGTPEDKMRLFLIYYISTQQAPSEVCPLFSYWEEGGMFVCRVTTARISKIEVKSLWLSLYFISVFKRKTVCEGCSCLLLSFIWEQYLLSPGETIPRKRLTILKLLEYVLNSNGRST